MIKKVVFTAPEWIISGANTRTANLIRGLNVRGFRAHLLLTRQKYFSADTSIPIPKDIPYDRLSVKHHDWVSRWLTLIHYLESNAPCFYFPTFDFEYSVISPFLSDKVAIVGIISGDVPMGYDHVRRLGRYWNRTVGVSKKITDQIKKETPYLMGNTRYICNGTQVPPKIPGRKKSSCINLLYVGRLDNSVKRVLDLFPVVRKLQQRNIPVRLTVVGDGQEKIRIVKENSDLISKGIVNLVGTIPYEQVSRHYLQNDIFLLTSKHEGFSESLLEAMAYGCVPIVSDIKSGVPELILNGLNGFIITERKADVFADRIELLWRDQKKMKRMGKEAQKTITRGGFDVDTMVDKYRDLLCEVSPEIETHGYHRPRGIMPIPKWMSDSVKFNRLEKLFILLFPYLLHTLKLLPRLKF